MTTNTNDELIKRAKGGDLRAFEDLVNAHKNVVFSLALRTLTNKQEAEEIAQDVFIKVFKSIQNFKGDSKFSTWLYRITYNCCLDHVRSKRKKFIEIPVDERPMDFLDDTKNALAMMQKDEKKKRILACLNALSPEDSAILTLYYFEEKNLNEVAKILDCKANSAKVRLHRARKRLAIILKERMEPEILGHYG